jgi:PadR family transcriptional regulator AphA
MDNRDLKTASYVVLGMLSIGSRSGYEIRTSAVLSLKNFWGLSPVQIYPELKRLEDAGLIHGRDEPRGGRARRLFDVTPAGEQALTQWLRDLDDIGDFEWRDLGLLKLFFADALEPNEVLEHVAALRDRANGYVRTLDREIIPAGERTLERHGKRYPVVIAKFGREFHAWMADWCERLEADLAAESQPRSRRVAP